MGQSQQEAELQLDLDLREIHSILEPGARGNLLDFPV